MWHYLAVVLGFIFKLSFWWLMSWRWNPLPLTLSSCVIFFRFSRRRLRSDINFPNQIPEVKERNWSEIMFSSVPLTKHHGTVNGSGGCIYYSLSCSNTHTRMSLKIIPPDLLREVGKHVHRESRVGLYHEGTMPIPTPSFSPIKLFSWPLHLPDFMDVCTAIRLY